MGTVGGRSGRSAPPRRSSTTCASIPRSTCRRSLEGAPRRHGRQSAGGSGRRLRGGRARRGAVPEVRGAGRGARPQEGSPGPRPSRDWDDHLQDGDGGRPVVILIGPRVVAADVALPAGPGSPGSRWACRPRSPGGPRRRACRRSGCQDRVAGLAAAPASWPPTVRGGPGCQDRVAGLAAVPPRHGPTALVTAAPRRRSQRPAGPHSG